MSELAGEARNTFIGDFPDVEAFLASDWADETFYAASHYREEFENDEAVRMAEERLAGVTLTEEDWDERLGAFGDLTFVYFWVADEENFRFRQFYDEFSDDSIRRALADVGPLHVECETTIYEDN